MLQGVRGIDDGVVLSLPLLSRHRFQYRLPGGSQEQSNQKAKWKVRKEEEGELTHLTLKGRVGTQFALKVFRHPAFKINQIESN